MLKQLSILVALSIVLLIFAPYAQMGLSYLDASHSFLNAKLSYIFSSSTAGNTTQEVASLLIIPLFFTGCVQAVYWTVKRQMMPYFYHILWTVWLILFTSLTLIK